MEDWDEDTDWLDAFTEEDQGRHRRGGSHRKPPEPPERHPNWCGCPDCRREIAQFESGQFKGFMVIVAVAVVLYLLYLASRAIFGG